jgi:hypothetical protein
VDEVMNRTEALLFVTAHLAGDGYGLAQPRW